MLLSNFRRRGLKRGLAFGILILAVIFVLTGGQLTRHVVRPGLFHSNLNGPSSSARDIKRVCSKHGFATYQNRGPKRKVFDLFLLSTELEWLEIRLNTLYPYVDYFVIVESSKTFTNMPKTLELANHWQNFTAFHPKMLHFAVEDEVISTRTWDHEDFFRNSLLYKTFSHLRGGEKQANDGDAIVVSDIDEIPKPETMMLLRHCDYPARLTLRSQFYYYSFQWLHRGPQWAHPQATVFQGLKPTISPVDLRNGDGGPGWLYLRPFVRWWQKADLWDAAWHCSSCFSSISDVCTKMGSFSHTPWNTKANRDPKTIVDRVRNGKDLFGREGEFYDKVEGNKDVPKFILENEHRFKYLLDRDGDDAAFTDYDPKKG